MTLKRYNVIAWILVNCTVHWQRINSLHRLELISETKNTALLDRNVYFFYFRDEYILQLINQQFLFQEEIVKIIFI